MDTSIKKVAFFTWFFWVFVYASSFCQDSPLKSDVETYFKSIYGGFSTPNEFKIIYQLSDKGNKKGALAESVKLINRVKKTPESKRKNFLLGSTYFIRGQLYGELGKNDSSILEFKKASSYGNPEAPYQLASRLQLYIKETGDTSKLNESLQYFEMGAELGDETCMDLVQVGLKATHEIEKENYWFLLLRMAGSTEEIRRFKVFYDEKYNDSDRTFLNNAFLRHSLTSKVTSSIPKLPGRSLLCAAYVDLVLRNMLGFIWEAFFSQTPQNKSFPMETVYEGFRSVYEKNNPLIKVYLLTNDKYEVKKPSTRLKPNKLVNMLLPGDQILVNCGPLNHYAIIWSNDISKHQITLLDPFYEFWQTSHNECVTSFKKDDYTYKSYKRSLIKIKSQDLQNMIVAAFTIRDRN
jgi:hypothetical protein